jgi:predicted RNA polymerase sigma factor
MLRRLDRREEALTAYRIALNLTGNRIEADDLRKRIAALE